MARNAICLLCECRWSGPVLAVTTAALAVGGVSGLGKLNLMRDSGEPTARIGYAASEMVGRDTPEPRHGGLKVSALLLGIGLGGFVDGVMLHQILQWHHMLSSEGSYPPTTVAGLEVNTLWDGLFHAFAWVLTAVGLALLVRAIGGGAPWSGRLLLGLMLAGWGTFNLVEGVIDHHVLGIHHVKADAPVLDLVFLAVGAVLLIGGLALARAGEREALGRSRGPWTGQSAGTVGSARGRRE